MPERDLRLEKLVGVLRRRGVILPAFEIHGGTAGLYDFGPIGGRLRNRVNQVWLEHWLKLGNVVELSCPTITPYPVLSASGHVGEFSDFLTTCGQCHVALRVDSLLQGFHQILTPSVVKNSNQNWQYTTRNARTAEPLHGQG